MKAALKPLPRVLRRGRVYSIYELARRNSQRSPNSAGKPCIKGTRIPAALVLGYLAAGRETDTILKGFPDLAAADVAACLDYARTLADFEAVTT